MQQQIGRYKILEEIARGGMGVVYRAMDPATQRVVALKLMLRLDNEVARKRFKREAKALARVDHPGVVRLFDFDVAPGGQPFMVMEVVGGETLQARLDRGGPFDPDEALALTLRLCDAVAACHRVGVLHRDLKPDNVLIDAQSRIKLTDFGITRDTNPSLSRTQLSEDGRFLGSPGYWAPEQAGGALDQIGEPTDVYGLGATLFALLTGSPPHEGTNLIEILGGVGEPKPAPSSRNPAVPPWLDAVVGKALETDPADRYASVGELAGALEAGTATSPPRRPPPPVAQLAALALVVVGLGAALVLVASANADAPAAGRSPLPGTPGSGAPSEATSDVSAAAAAAFARGQEAYAAGRYEAGRDAFTAAIRLQPDHAEAFYYRGVARFELNDVQGAVEDFSQALRLEPNSVAAYVNRGVARGKAGDWQGQAEDCTEAIRLQPDLATAYFHRGVASGALLAWEAVAEDMGRALALEPGASWADDAYAHRGLARGNLGDSQGLLADFTEAIRLEPDFLEVYINRGIVRGSLGDWQGQVEDCTEAIRIQPDLAVAYFNRSLAREQLGDHEGELADLARALELAPDASWARQARERLQSARQQLADPQGGGGD